MEAYIDADWDGCIDDWKSTSGDAFFLGDRLVSCHSKKLDSISLSTAEVEYIVAATSFSQMLWMKKILKDIQVDITDPILIRCDNSGAINIEKNLVMHSRTKHISIKYHFLKEKVE